MHLEAEANDTERKYRRMAASRHKRSRPALTRMCVYPTQGSGTEREIQSCGCGASTGCWPPLLRHSRPALGTRLPGHMRDLKSFGRASLYRCSAKRIALSASSAHLSCFSQRSFGNLHKALLNELNRPSHGVGIDLHSWQQICIAPTICLAVAPHSSTFTPRSSGRRRGPCRDYRSQCCERRHRRGRVK